MNNLHIENSYNIWLPKQMKEIIKNHCEMAYGNPDPKVVLNRKNTNLIIEWWLHNVGYYVSNPLKKIKYFKRINNRCKDVDLEEWKRKNPSR